MRNSYTRNRDRSNSAASVGKVGVSEHTPHVGGYEMGRACDEFMKSRGLATPTGGFRYRRADS